MGSNDITKAQKDLDSCKNPTGKLKFIKRSEGVCDQALLHFYFQKTTLSSFFVNLKCHRVTMIERARKSAPTTTADLVYPLYGYILIYVLSDGLTIQIRNQVGLLLQVRFLKHRQSWQGNKL